LISDREVWDSLPSQLSFKSIVVEERVGDFVSMEDLLPEGGGDFSSGRWGPLPLEVVAPRCLSFVIVVPWAVCELIVLLLVL